MYAMLTATNIVGYDYTNSTYSDPDRNEIDFIDDKNKVLIWFLLLHVILNVSRARSHWVASIQHI